jgi:hypothetical protein
MLLLDGSNTNIPSLQLRRNYTGCFSMKLINTNICRTTQKQAAFMEEQITLYMSARKRHNSDLA